MKKTKPKKPTPKQPNVTKPPAFNAGSKTGTKGFCVLALECAALDTVTTDVTCVSLGSAEEEIRVTENTFCARQDRHTDIQTHGTQNESQTACVAPQQSGALGNTTNLESSTCFYFKPEIALKK